MSRWLVLLELLENINDGNNKVLVRGILQKLLKYRNIGQQDDRPNDAATQCIILKIVGYFTLVVYFSKPDKTNLWAVLVGQNVEYTSLRDGKSTNKWDKLRAYCPDKYIYCDFGAKRKKKLVKVVQFFLCMTRDIYPVYHHKDNQLGKNLHTQQWGHFFMNSKLHLHNF